jgi:hypothetical protein
MQRNIFYGREQNTKLSFYVFLTNKYRAEITLNYNLIILRVSNSFPATTFKK